MSVAAPSRAANETDAVPFRPVHLGTTGHSFEHRPDGTVLVRAVEPLGPYPVRLTDHLIRWAQVAPERTFVAKRDRTGAWQRLTYGEALEQARTIGAALLARGLSAERPLVILSGNDLDHATLGLAALHVGVPYAAISPAYSRVSQDFARLRDIVRLLTPGLVYAQDGARFAEAISATVPADVEIATLDGTMPGRTVTSLAAGLPLLPAKAGIQPTRRGPPDPDASWTPAFAGASGMGADVTPDDVESAHGRVGADTIAKFLFTSGSTGLPKAVINTHGMLCANQAQLGATFAFLADAPPILVDWLSWHHTFGGNHNFGLVLANGGTLYIDDGQPVPAAIGETVRNLKEIAPTAYFTVPKGYEALLPHLDRDPDLRRSFFSRLEVAFFAAAGLPQPVWDAFDAAAIRECGERVTMLTGLGSSETAPFALTCSPAQSRSGHVGLPARGVDLKLAAVAEKVEARVKGPNVTPGYWRNPALTAAAFDEEGYYRMGDALRFVDPADLEMGLKFDGRLNEDFKLTSGVWVSVGTVRARFLNRSAPYARDIALAGENLDEVAALIVPDLDACRRLCPDLPPDADAASVLDSAEVRGTFAAILASLAGEATGSSNRIARALLVAEPPSMDRNEITDKGSINQRAMLTARSDRVAELYRKPMPARVISPAEGPP